MIWLTLNSNWFALFTSKLICMKAAKSDAIFTDKENIWIKTVVQHRRYSQDQERRQNNYSTAISILSYAFFLYFKMSSILCIFILCIPRHLQSTPYHYLLCSLFYLIYTLACILQLFYQSSSKSLQLVFSSKFCFFCLEILKI